MSSLFFPVSTPNGDYTPSWYFKQMPEDEKRALARALNPFPPAAAASPQPCAVESSLSAYAGKIAAEQEIRDMGIEIPAHDPATCWWCQNPQSETEVHHMMEHK